MRNVAGLHPVARYGFTVEGMLRDGESSTEFVPSGCTLPIGEQPLRVAEFDDLFGAALRRVDRPDPAHLALVFAEGPGTEATLRDLTDREVQCCVLPSAVRGDGGTPGGTGMSAGACLRAAARQWRPVFAGAAMHAVATSAKPSLR